MATSDKGQDIRHSSGRDVDIVFDKSVFSSVFNKDVRRVYIYKKAERLASALYLIAPAFRDSVSLRTRLESLAVTLTEAASLSGARLAEALSRELLSLSSLLAMAEAGGLLSRMNGDLIIREAQALLTEVTLYEEPRLALSEPTTFATLAKQAPGATSVPPALPLPRAAHASMPGSPSRDKGHNSIRQDNLLTFIREKGSVSIKDLAGVVRGVSEKTIQRELQALIEGGQIEKRGERRWTTYSASR